MESDSIMLAGEIDLSAVEQALDDRHRLGEPLDPRAA
jgi:hypothetical protein